MLRYLLLLIILLSGLRPGSIQAGIVEIRPDTDGLWLGRNLDIIRDTDDTLTLESLQSGQQESRFFQVPQDVPTLGYFNGNHYWARFTLRNPTAGPVELFLTSRYATIDYVTLFWPDAQGRYQSLTLGDCVAYTKRVIENRQPVFPITVPPGDHTYYVRLQTTTAIQFSLSLFSPAKFLNHEIKESNYLGLLFGVCFVMFFYNFFVSIKFNSKAYIAYVGYIFVYTIFAALYHGVLQQYVFPDMENGWIFKNFIFITIDLMSVSCATFSIEFLELRRSAPRLYRILYIFRVALALNVLNWMTLGLAAKHITLTSNFFFSVALMGIGFYRSFSYRPARYYTLGWTIFLSSNLIMLLGNNGIINVTFTGPWAQFTGAALELILLSLALGDRVALINSERQESLLQQQKLQEKLIQSERDKAAVHASLLLEREGHIRGLDRLVFERTRDIQSILATINQGILTIGLRNGLLHVGPEYSQYLGTILATQEIQNKDPFQLIFARSELSSEVIDQTRQVLFSCLGEPEISYDVNRDHLIREVILRKEDGTSLYIEMDWLPVLGPDETIDKILVILRDVTQLRFLREQTRAQEHQLLMTGELTSKQGRKFPRLYATTISHIQRLENQMDSRSRSAFFQNDEKLVFLRFLHTLKADARVFGLRTLAQCIHDAESHLVGLTTVAHHEALQVMRQMTDILEQYDQIWRERLGFQQEIEDRHTLPADLMARLFNFLEDLMHKGPRDIQDASRHLHQQVNQAYGWDLATILKDQLHSSASLAHELKKQPPHIVIEGEPCAIPPELHSTLCQVFGHLIANSMDHGIEDRETRLKAGKMERGTISLKQECVDGMLHLVYHDDGRGLNINGLRRQGKKMDATPDEAAEMIFLSGLSTSQQTSMISGRGIGMSAVREILEGMGGRIQISLGQPHDHDQNFQAFRFIMTLPMRKKTSIAPPRAV